jgi:FkbM family methyltransferase
MNAALRGFARNLLPARALHAYRMLRHTVLAPFERELAVIPQYLSPDAVAVDVGANVGLYTAVMARRAARVLAFEPHPDCAAHLRALRLARCEVVEAALSDTDGQSVLRVPCEGRGDVSALGTLAAANELRGGTNAGRVREIPVRTLRLDVALAERLAAAERPGAADKIGFIKIDVEGHERAVLQGAAATIARHRPVLLVEIEARHGSDVEAIFAMMAGHRYGAFALIENHPLAAIDPATLRAMQSPERLARKMVRPRDTGYVHNVFFLPDERGAAGP